MTGQRSRIAVLLSTFNGERYVATQLDSLLTQDYDNLVILARDDGSTDGTREILRNVGSAHPDRMVLLPNDGRNLGACEGFARLIDYALEHKFKLGLTPAYLAFCDQDDVWDTDKLSISMAAMKKQEKLEIQENQENQERSSTVPVLVHTDLRVVDSNLDELAPSLVAYQGLTPQKMNFGRVLVANAVTGCTLLINEPLARLATPIPTGAIMHDWWIAILARLKGRTVFVERATVSYRQHQHNALGARESRSANSAGEWLRRSANADSITVYEQLAQQSRALVNAHGATINAGTLRICQITNALAQGHILQRKLAYRLIRRL